MRYLGNWVTQEHMTDDYCNLEVCDKIGKLPCQKCKEYIRKSTLRVKKKQE